MAVKRGKTLESSRKNVNSQLLPIGVHDLQIDVKVSIEDGKGWANDTAIYRRSTLVYDF